MKKKYAITNQPALRDAFWASVSPGWRSLRRNKKKQNDYPVDLRQQWVNFVDHMQKDRQISEALAQRATL